ncbi:tetratricopeptide repeat protein [Phenylobacterium sp.]|uniref:tetratricopeptide repeat protein n=1 Tax=Phenylobacterium sp. TaxID=1871053 RepID=UPI0025E1C34A|nr:tetratricopeptide repeat protein [Phenylobacterium sp.]MBX3482494.1 tetratricopeptide repeat protein [Phenylobacterium sp.]MCW5759282.1 tetratricopeptide repeat protein [Phenylobacterium sp.]
MPLKDHHGLEYSGASPAAAERYLRAVAAFHCYAGQPFPELKAAVADSPRFVMAHVLIGYMTLVGGNAALRRMGAAAHAALRDLPMNGREAGHAAAVGHILAGEVRAAARALEDVALAWPRDVLALQVGQTMDFLLGDARMLRDRIGRVRGAWTPDMPGYHAILGLHAFGLEETAHYGRAEAAGREAVALEPRNNWARHAVAHVLEMQDRRAEGVRFMRDDAAVWTADSFFLVHNWWHTALFHLGLGETDAVLELYDGPIRGEASDLAFDMADAAALLWRLRLRDVDVGDRWATLADGWSGHEFGRNAFEDAHAVMTLVGAGRDAEAEAAVAALTAATGGTGDNAAATRDVGLPVAQAFLAYGRGRHRHAADLLRDVRSIAHRFGGSHAQRDVLDLTLIDAAARAGDTALAHALVAERKAALP